MADGSVFEFNIREVSPDRLPMSELAAYIGDLAALLGNEESIHFQRIKAGSARIEYWVEPEAVRDVTVRMVEAARPNALPALRRAYRAIDDRLRKAGWSGRIVQPIDHDQELSWSSLVRVLDPSIGSISGKMERSMAS